MGRVDGEVAFITGAARGQGRAHAIRLAEEGADIVGVDLLDDIGTVPFGLGTQADLDETAALVRATGRAMVACQVDVRNLASVEAAVADGLAAFGFISIVSANAGIISYQPGHLLSPGAWKDVIDVNLTGAWHTVRAVVPSMIAARRGGSIVLTSSMAGVRGVPNAVHYTAAKHGVIGLMRAFAAELAPHAIRVNCVLPSSVNTPMVHNETVYGLFNPEVTPATLADAMPAFVRRHPLRVPWMEPADIAQAVLWLASGEARYVTGVTLPVDAGFLLT